MTSVPIRVPAPGRILILGFGSIGQGILPLILRHIEIDRSDITIVTADDAGRDEAAEYGIQFIRQPLMRHNYLDVLSPLLTRGDFLLNVSVDVSSSTLMELCHHKGALYLDTCIEPWLGEGGYFDPKLTASQRSNYAYREAVLELRRRLGDGPTAVVAHGANPGIVSHLVKQALLNLSEDSGSLVAPPTTRFEWAELAQRLGIRVIHIAERDTQVGRPPKSPGEFVNTWSVDGFFSEGCQPAELGWGTHEAEIPPDGERHQFGSDCGIILRRPGVRTLVRSWTPLEGPFLGFLITHNESLSIADYFSLRNGRAVVYRPTVHYAYHPCDDAVLSIHEFVGKNWVLQSRKRIMRNEILHGVDELGVLLMGHARGAYWYGSQLSVDEARRLAPFNNATSLQVTSAALAGMIWALKNPDRGIVEAEEMDFRSVLDVCEPYLGTMTGAYSNWTPLEGDTSFFASEIDQSDPWQFKNFRVS